MTITIRPVRPGDAEMVADKMRVADAAEVMAWAGLEPLPAMRASLSASDLKWTACRNHWPICCFGVTGLRPGVGQPWALGTDEIDREPVAFLRQSRRALGWMLAAYPRLENWTDARHVKSHAWLRWLGFTLHPARAVGFAGLPFHPFDLEVT